MPRSIDSVADITQLELKVPHVDRPINPDFGFMNQSSADMLSSAYSVMNEIEGWTFLANFAEESFIFSNNPTVHRLTRAVSNKYNYHSGYSMGWTMRQLEYIAKNGFTAYKACFSR